MRRVTLLAAFLFSTLTVFAQQPPQSAGEIRRVVPAGSIQRSGAPVAQAKAQDPVFWNDVVRTDRAGRVRIGLLDGSILNVGRESQLQVRQHDAATQNTQLDLAYGRIRANVVRATRPGSGFTVRTHVATVGVVGTRFILRANADFAEILCLEGSVRVHNRDESVAGEVIVRPGEFTRVYKGQPPTPPEPASEAQKKEAEEETDLPAAADVSRVELSWPPAACGERAELLLRGYTKQMQEGREVEEPVESESLTGTLRLGAETVYVEGGRALLSAPPSSEPPEGAFTPAGRAAAVPTKIYPPLAMAEGQGWRAPRAVFRGSAFYVLGPLGFGQAALRIAGQYATLLWQGPCGAGFLAPMLPGAQYDVTLSLSGNVVARGRMNLIEISYRVPVPPAVLRNQETQFGIDLRGLAGLDQFTGGRPVMTVVLTNRTPMIIGNLRSPTRGAQASGETITYLITGVNVDPAGNVRLDGLARGRQAGTFDIGVNFDLDDALEKPRTPLTPATSP